MRGVRGGKKKKGDREVSFRDNIFLIKYLGNVSIGFLIFCLLS